MYSQTLRLSQKLQTVCNIIANITEAIYTINLWKNVVTIYRRLIHYTFNTQHYQQQTNHMQMLSFMLNIIILCKSEHNLLKKCSVPSDCVDIV